MAGPGAILRGCAIPLQNYQPAQANQTPPWDHTYVESSCGLRWGCWGRTSAGRPIISGVGDSAIADCLSQVQSRAGIIYGVSGVCHQTANRILYPAGRITVAACNGYPFSFAAYGDYGLFAFTNIPPFSWNPQLQGCLSSGNFMSGVKGSNVASSGKGMVISSSYHALIRGDAAQESARVEELSRLVKTRLGSPLDDETFRVLSAIHLKLRQAQTILAGRLMGRGIAPERYFAQLNDALREFSGESRSLLGDDRFVAIFGEAGKYPEGLVDRDTFMTQFSHAP